MMQIHNGNQPPHRHGMAAGMAQREEDAPGWALGLRNLYKAVADEPVPAEFGDLLARLDGRSARPRSPWRR